MHTHSLAHAHALTHTLTRARPSQHPTSPPIPQGGGRWVYDYAITNVEYTEFERLGIEDVAVEGSNHSVFPANTNILYVGLERARRQVEAAVAAGGGDVLPGLIFNMKKKVRGECVGWRWGEEGWRRRRACACGAQREGVRAATALDTEASQTQAPAAHSAVHPPWLPANAFLETPPTTKPQVKYFDPLAGQERAVYAGRMECTMQNLADAITTRGTGPISLPADAPGGGDGLADALNNGAGGGGVDAAAELAEKLDTFLVYNMRRKVGGGAGVFLIVSMCGL